MISQSSFLRKCEEKKCCFFKNFNVDTKEVNPKTDDNICSDLDKLKIDTTKKGSRFPLTLGPVIKRYNSKSQRKKRFKKKKYLQDLRTDDNTFLLNPHETISILSNEYIETDNETGAFIFPRLSLADVGIALIPTYVDPFWKGILQMTLVNTTNKSIRIKLGESIAVIFFNKIDEHLSDEYSSSFPTNSHHYGQTWEKIINQDAEAFLNKKHHENESLWQAISNCYQEYKKHIFTTALLMTLISLVFNFGRIYGDIKEVTNSLQEFKKIRHEVNTGTTILQIKKNENSVYKIIDVNIKSGSIPIVFAKIKNPEILGRLHATIAETDNDLIKKISFHYESPYKSKDDKEIDIQWILLP